MTNPSPSAPAHVVAVIGGATAGAEVAGRLAQRGAQVIVIEQNPRPYGKVEDGLPRWHHGLRQKEYETIRGKLGQPGVHFLPLTKIGRDISFDDLTKGWGLSAVVLACGAWRDRPLALEGAEKYVGKGLVYQNPFIIWFNHANEKAYTGPRFDVKDGALIVGGGLASIDVAKVHTLETTRAKLRERGIDAPLIELEVGGIPKLLAKHGLAWKDLGLEGCTLFYRRRLEDMPLMDAPDGADAARLAKVEVARKRMLEKALEKYLFKVEPLASPEGLIVEGDRLVGLRFRRNKVEAGKLVPSDETFERRGPYVVSSIGSIPDPIPGIPTRGELFDFRDPNWGRLPGHEHVFSVGNVVTGKGNIVASRKHATSVSQAAIEAFLGIAGDGKAHAGEEALAASISGDAGAQAEAVAGRIEPLPRLAAERVAAVLEKVRERQRAVGYSGDLGEWLAKVTPPDLE